MKGSIASSSPYTDPVGLAIYFEPTVGDRFLEFDTRILVQKNYFDDRLILAANITWAPEIRYLPGNPYAPARQCRGQTERQYRNRRELGNRRILSLRAQLVVRLGIAE